MRPVVSWAGPQACTFRAEATGQMRFYGLKPPELSQQTTVSRRRFDQFSGATIRIRQPSA